MSASGASRVLGGGGAGGRQTAFGLADFRHQMGATQCQERTTHSARLGLA